jgi:hypothetical protein
MPTSQPVYLLRCVRDEWRRFLAGLTDPAFLGLAALGLIAWLLPRPAFHLTPGLLLLKAAVEETAFRAGLQDILASVLHTRQGLASITRANLLTSVMFSLVHLGSHPPLWAGLVFFPSLGFGLLWDRNRSLLLCILLHFLYNLLLFYRA